MLTVLPAACWYYSTLSILQYKPNHPGKKSLYRIFRAAVSTHAAHTHMREPIGGIDPLMPYINQSFHGLCYWFSIACFLASSSICHFCMSNSTTRSKSLPSILATISSHS